MLNRFLSAGITAAALFALTALSLPAFAQVTYLADVDASGLPSILNTTFTSLPPGITAQQSSGIDEHTGLLISMPGYVSYNTQTGAQSGHHFLPGSVKLSDFSLAAVYYDNTPSPRYRSYFLTAQGGLVQWDLLTLQVVLASPIIDAGDVPFSLSAASNDAIAMIYGDGGSLIGFTLNKDTGATTQIFDSNGGSGVGEFSDARFLSYGPDGRLYVLDYGNNRIQGLDPSSGYASVFQFNLNPGVPLTNTQFSISSSGNFIFGDGAGGGSVYDSAGNFVEAFSLPSGSYVPGRTGKYHTAVLPDGNLLVYDATGEHLYSLAVAPEPGSFALLGMVALPIVGMIRRRTR